MLHNLEPQTLDSTHQIPISSSTALTPNSRANKSKQQKEGDDHVLKWAARLCGEGATIADATAISHRNQQRWETSRKHDPTILAERQQRLCPHRKTLLRFLKWHFAACDAILQELRRVAAPADQERTRALLSRYPEIIRSLRQAFKTTLFDAFHVHP